MDAASVDGRASWNGDGNRVSRSKRVGKDFIYLNNAVIDRETMNI